MKHLIAILLSFLFVHASIAQVPAGYSNIKINPEGVMYLSSPDDGIEIPLYDPEPKFKLSDFRDVITGTLTGLHFKFGKQELNGTLYYGFIDLKEPQFRQPVFFKTVAEIKNGEADIDISALSGIFDMTGWQETGLSRLGYRIVDEDGKFLYDGIINVKGKGPFAPDLTVTEGPFLQSLDHSGAIFKIATNVPGRITLVINETEYVSEGKINHEIQVEGLDAGSRYEYTVIAADFEDRYFFETAPAPGSRKPFMFSYASDSRAGKGGGERNIYGTNAYIMKRIAALLVYRDARFFQFTGDLINGYSTSVDETQLQYYNWFRNISPYSGYVPFNVAMGNHEVLNYIFTDKSGSGWAMIDMFPYETQSSESLFGRWVSNPLNGPESEDGSRWDPDPEAVDFPSYKENVFYYTYDNVAMICLNSNYWYAPTKSMIPVTGGNPHGYLMDNQLDWLAGTVASLEEDDDIDHVFVTLHTPPFPNGGHASDDMWYAGDNGPRPYIAGEAVDKGIIQRRDEFLDILVNKGSKVLAILCGDEHNYSRIKIEEGVPIYPDGWEFEKLKLSRPVWQLTNGSAGAPYYAQEELPWSDHVEIFSTQYALIFFHIEGKNVRIEVINPDTLEIIEEVTLRE